MDVPYETVNILADERLRSGMKEYSMVRRGMGRREASGGYGVHTMDHLRAC
jgi:hypothetical protein